MVRNAQAIAEQGGPETVELITQYYGPVTKTAQSKIDAVNAQTRPPVAPSPALDENPPPDP